MCSICNSAHPLPGAQFIAEFDQQMGSQLVLIPAPADCLSHGLQLCLPTALDALRASQIQVSLFPQDRMLVHLIRPATPVRVCKSLRMQGQGLILLDSWKRSFPVTPVLALGMVHAQTYSHA